MFPFISLLGLCFYLSFAGFVFISCFVVDLRCSLLHFIELEFQRLDLAHQTLVYYTQDVNFLNSFENMLTNVKGLFMEPK